MEQNVEVKETQPKKKRNWLFTLFACIATGVIVFLAMNIGEDLGKTVDPKTDSSNNKKVACEEKECDCKEENTTTETNSNTTTNSNSNTTQQQPQTQPTATSYTSTQLKGTYTTKTENYTRTIRLYENGLFELDQTSVGGFMRVGNYIINNDTITFTNLIDGQGAATVVNKTVTGKINSVSSFTYEGNTYTKVDNGENNTLKNWSNILSECTKDSQN